MGSNAERRQSLCRYRGNCVDRQRSRSKQGFTPGAYAGGPFIEWLPYESFPRSEIARRPRSAVGDCAQRRCLVQTEQAVAACQKPALNRLRVPFHMTLGMPIETRRRI